MDAELETLTSREAALAAENARLRQQLAQAALRAKEVTADVSAASEAHAASLAESQEETHAAREDMRRANDAAAQVAEAAIQIAAEHRADVASHRAQTTRREELYTALQTSEGRLRLILESATDFAIFTTDLDGHVTEWNVGAQNILGWNEAEMLGQDVRVVWTPEDRKAGIPEREMYLAREEGQALDERWHMRRDGSRFWAMGELMPMQDEAGRLVGYLKILRNRTAQHEAELRLLESEAELRIQRGFLDALIRQAPVGISISDAATGRPVVLNDKAHELLGHADLGDDLDRYTRYGALHADGRPYSAEDYPTIRTLRHGVTIEREAMIYRQGGIDADQDASLRRLEVSSTPIRDASDQVVAAVTVLFDVEELEQRVAAEMAERAKAEEQLRQSQKMEAVGQLTGGLAHDFNNLLTGISGSLELLDSRIKQGRLNNIDRYVAAAQGAAKRAAALTHRLLAFSRRQTLDPKPTQVNQLVMGIEDMIQRTVGPGIVVETVTAGGLWNTLVDPGQLENALLNLCINARDAMPDGGRITIETSNKWFDERAARKRDLTAGHYVLLCVSDTGVGMPPEVVARAFDPFFTTKPIGKGTGLGLSMIYGFAQQSGGQVRITSEPGHGAMVCLCLPRHLGAEDGIELPPGMADAPRSLQGETVLVVDDEPTVRMLVTEVLEDSGYTAIEASDGAGGLTVLQSDVHVDLLVTDVGLPGGMNGRQIADAARVIRPDLKVLFITGYAENAVLSHGQLDCGMHVLTKPFTLEALASRIKEMLAGR